MRIALYDLDHTLLPHDTQALFCNYVLKNERWRVLLHFFFLPFALARAVKICGTTTAKRAFHAYLWGLPKARLERYARDFAAESVDSWIYPELRAELLRHRHQGRVTILNTASPGFYARAIAEHLDFQFCIATDVRVSERMPFFPEIRGQNNKRQVKIDTMLRVVPALADQTEAERADSWAYSDSAADIPLLEFCTHRILVHPRSELRRHFIQDSRAIELTPPLPYTGRMGNLISIVRQILGLYPVSPARN